MAWLLDTDVMSDLIRSPAGRIADRIREVAKSLPEYGLIFNVQGDEPFLDPATLEVRGSLVVYGTTTFPWFGSNWAGSTLRNDWMVLLGLGVCALGAFYDERGDSLQVDTAPGRGTTRRGWHRAQMTAGTRRCRGWP